VNGQEHVPAALYPRERSGTHFTGGWVGITIIIIIIIIIIIMGHSVAQLVDALCYKLESRGFDSLGSTQPLTKMSTRDILWGIKAGGA